MEVAAGIHFVQRGWANANAIYLAGKQAALVDPGSEAGFAGLIKSLQALDLDPSSIQTIWNTHTHWDHCGANEALTKLTGAEIWSGELTREWMGKPERELMWLDFFEADMPVCAPSKAFEADSLVYLGSHEWQIIHLPGHAPDLCGLWQPQERILISADALLPGGDCGILNTALHGWDECLSGARRSVERMKALQPRIVLPGHGPIIENVGEALEGLSRKLDQFEQKPPKLVRHLLARILVAAVLELEHPVPEKYFFEWADRSPWAEPYARIMEMPVQQMIRESLDYLLAQGTLYQVHSGTDQSEHSSPLLSSPVPR